MEHKNIPEIRFSGFTNEWEQRKSKELCTISTGKGNTQDKIDDGIYPFYVRSATIEKSNDYLYDQEAVLTVGDGVGTGKVFHYVNGKYNLHQRVYRMYDFNYVSAKYFYYYFSKNFYKRVMSMTAKTSVDSVRMEMIADMNIVFPSVKEQEKIVALFSNLDDTIALHQRKLYLLKEQKKGFLQKMFPKNGETVPELRFSGFTNEWEQRKLGELSNIVGGGTPSTSNPEYWDGDIDWYAPAEIGEQSYVSKSKKTITELGLKKSSARILPVGTVLFTSRAGIGNTAILAKEATTNQGFQSIVPDQNKLDSYFIFSRTNELKRYGEVTGAGSTFVEVSGKQMSKMSIMVPELSEQQKIGSFFKQLDDTIVLHQRKLELLKEQKKGFLQKMFPKNS